MAFSCNAQKGTVCLALGVGFCIPVRLLLLLQFSRSFRVAMRLVKLLGCTTPLSYRLFYELDSWLCVSSQTCCLILQRKSEYGIRCGFQSGGRASPDGGRETEGAFGFTDSRQ